MNSKTRSAASNFGLIAVGGPLKTYSVYKKVIVIPPDLRTLTRGAVKDRAPEAFSKGQWRDYPKQTQGTIWSKIREGNSNVKENKKPKIIVKKAVEISHPPGRE